MGAYTFADAYAGLTFTTQNYETGPDGNPWVWETVNVTAYASAASNDVWKTHKTANAEEPVESGDFVIYEVNTTGGTGWRSEVEHRLALNWRTETYPYQLGQDTQYAIAMPVTIESDGTDLGRLCIIAQIHDGSNNPLSLIVGDVDGGSDTGLFIEYEHDSGTYEYTLLTAAQFSLDTRYEIVWAFTVSSASPGTDTTSVYVDGVKKHDETDAAADLGDADIFHRAGNPYFKHGAYWASTTGTDATWIKNKVARAGYGEYNGVDAIAAALIRVQET